MIFCIVVERIGRVKIREVFRIVFDILVIFILVLLDCIIIIIVRVDLE